MYELQLIRGQASVRRRQFSAGPVRLGRDPEAEVALAPSPEVSRRHARLDRELDAWTVTDEGSANGTFVNGVRLVTGQPRPLIPGDAIALGDGGTTVLRYGGGPEPEADLRLSGPGVQAVALFESLLGGADLRSLTRARDRLYVLYEASRAVFARLSDLRSLLDRIKEEVVRALNVDEMIVALKEPDGEVTFDVVSRANRFRSVEIAGSKTLIAQVLDSGRAVWLDPEQAAIGTSASFIRHNIRTAMCVPLVFRDRILGAIYVQNPEHGGAEFTPADFDFLTAFAAQAAIALHAARDAESRSRLLETLRREQIEGRDGMDPGDPLAALAGESTAIRAVKSLIIAVKDLPSTVLIHGESGTGKELVAKALHYGGIRRDKPFVSVSIAAFAGGVLESELFGHEKGAFTGAHGRKVGRFELAEQGTLFLDEIGEVPATVQVKLLRVLQERRFERVGGNQPLAVDVRFVFATNRDLQEATRKGDFREDLYYRVSVVPIHLPPLRDRLDDVPILTAALLQRLRARLGIEVRGVTPEAERTLAGYPYPGNVRELENLLERALIRLKIRGGERIEVDDLPLELKPSGRSLPAPGLEVPQSYAGLKQVEREMVLQALRQTGWNKRRAAQLLGITHQTLYSRIDEFGLKEGA